MTFTIIGLLIVFALMGALLYPTLTQAGYTDRFSLGLVTTSGILGLLLPPSLPLILYGIIAQQMNGVEQVSSENLFLSGLFPALLMIVMLSIWSLWANRENQVPLTQFSVRNCLSALKTAGWEVPLPLFVFFGIYSGYPTAPPS